MTDSRTYHAVRFTLGDSQRYLVWYDGEQGGVLLRQPGRIAIFSSLDEVDAALQRLRVQRDPAEPSTFDFNRLSQWLAALHATPLDCVLLLDSWNLFEDIVESVGAELPLSDASDIVYDKLFWGCQPTAIGPTGTSYVPHWSAEEIATLAKVLASGLRQFMVAAQVSRTGIKTGRE